MINAGTIGATLTLDTAPFCMMLDSAVGKIARAGILGDENGEKISALGSVLQTVGASIDPCFVSPFAAADSKVEGLCDSIVVSVTDAADDTAGQAERLSNGIVSPLNSAASSAYGIMSNFGEGLLSGLASKQAAILAKARSIANSVTGTIRAALGIASPSRVMREVGRNTAEGLVIGLTEMRGQVAAAAGGIAAATCDAIQTSAPEPGRAAETSLQIQKTETVRNNQTQEDSALVRRLDTLISLLSDSRQSIELDRRVFGQIVREYT